MIGIDIVEISRIKELYEKFGDKFLKRILHIKEIEIIKAKKDIFPAIAGRFAVKEAYVKASGDKSINFNLICVLNKKDGKPFFQNIPDFEISISHERNYAVAVVLKKSKND
ncbi:MAG: holo-ACP synthase [Candidatus Muirbacterium halophilum]|nr:holo-ACP synthase [Candidatus Muirbacterium halophilum]MCK9474703.1 holo-ACP synthase [Candidatus Muirbacterium halophilum]